MSKEWIINEIEGVNLGDKRLEKRLAETLETLSGSSDKSITHAVKGRAEREAIYRFISNPNVSFEKILAPHHLQTEIRAQKEPVVLFVQDTTEINLTRPQQQVQGAGPLQSENTKRFGCFIHSLQAYTPQGIPLGCYWEKNWTRDINNKTGIARIKELQHLPIDKKESFRWLEGFRKTGQFAQRNLDVTTVCIGDSESDIFTVLVEPRQSPNHHLIVRGCHNRSIESTDPSLRHIREQVSSTPPLATLQITARARVSKTSVEIHPRKESREQRDATVLVHATSVTLKAPAKCKNVPQTMSLNVVLVKEENPPDEETPIEWILLTTLPIQTIEEVIRVIDYYRVRWQIEIFFRVLKQGCLVEKRRFETIERIYNCLSLYMLISWHIIYLCYMSRYKGEMSCEFLFERSEWKPVVTLRNKKGPTIEIPPTLGEFMLMIAELGGYKNRKSPPGVETIWKGLRDVTIMAECWDTFGPEARAST